MSVEHQKKQVLSPRRALLISMLAGGALAWIHFVSQGPESDQPYPEATTSPLAPNWSQTSIAIQNRTPSPLPGVFEYRQGRPTITPLISERSEGKSLGSPIVSPVQNPQFTQDPLEAIR
jgi:hypothetical protein